MILHIHVFFKKIKTPSLCPAIQYSTELCLQSVYLYFLLIEYLYPTPYQQGMAVRKERIQRWGMTVFYLISYPVVDVLSVWIQSLHQLQAVLSCPVHRIKPWLCSLQFPLPASTAMGETARPW